MIIHLEKCSATNHVSPNNRSLYNIDKWAFINFGFLLALKSKGVEKSYKKIMVGSRNNGHYCPNSRENS